MTSTLQNSVTAKIFAGVAGVAMAMTFAFAPVAAVNAQSSDAATIQALLEGLGIDSATIAAVVAAMGGGSSSSASCSVTFTQNLTTGSTGAEVMAVQEFLNDMGFQVSATGAGSPGNETTYFGSRTAAAVAQFQNAYASDILAPVGLSQGTGYWGNSTRAKANMLCNEGGMMPGDDDDNDSGSGSTGNLEGGAGDIESVEFVSGYNNEEVGEDEEDVVVAGWEIEATDGSDIEIRAVTLDFDYADSGADDDLDDYATEVSVWFDGEKVAELDADEFDDDNNYRRSVTLDRGVVIDSDDTEEIVVAVSGINNLDSGNEGEKWNVSLNSIRFADAQGAVITYNSGADMESTADDDTTTNADEREFTFESFSSAADLELNVSDGDDDINDSRVIMLDDSDDTDGEVVFSFELEAEGDSDVEVKDIPVFWTAAGTGAPTVAEVINSAELFIDGESYGSENVSISGTTGTTTFEDIDYTIDAGDTVEVTVEVDFNNLDGTTLQDGNTLKAELRSFETDAIDAEDENGDDLVAADLTGTASSEAHTVSLTGVTLSGVEDSKNTLGNDDTTGSISWVFTLKAEDGAIDFNIADKTDVNGSSDDVLFTLLGPDTPGDVGTTTITLLSGEATADGTGYTIADGDDATFSLDTTFDTVASADAGTYYVRLDSVEGIKVDETSVSLQLAN